MAALAVVPCPERQAARPRRASHRVLGVDDEVHQNLVELVTVRPQSRQGLGAVEDDLDIAGAQLVGQQLERRPNHVVEVDLATLRRMAARDRQEIAHDANTAIGGGVDLFASRGGREGRTPAPQQMGLTDHDGERIVELVGDAGQELAHRGELLGL